VLQLSVQILIDLNNLIFRVVIILSGGNIDSATMAQLLMKKDKEGGKPKKDIFFDGRNKHNFYKRTLF
jgi:hypothetical protein